MDLYIILAAFLGYGSGSIPFGLLFTKAAGLGDVRQIGSGNIGATNVLRTGNKAIAAATLLSDLLKGTVPVWLAWQYGEIFALAAALGAFMGHLYPVWLKFKGGKGVATYIGILLGLSPYLFALFAAAWLATAFSFRYSSLAALVAAGLCALASLWLTSANASVTIVLLTVMIFARHHENIARLLKGEESRISFSKKA